MQQAIFAENEREDLSVPLVETAVSSLLIGRGHLIGRFVFAFSHFRDDFRFS